ncbi:hypothetical protein ENTCAN_09291 [Enterobacter cancerogenus ATCC 35316]|nr:hypothetical protein ENTCAN_09291 [Enterobacter cancerogenus ATCC 35316]
MKRDKLLLKTADYPAKPIHLFRNDEKLREIVSAYKISVSA